MFNVKWNFGLAFSASAHKRCERSRKLPTNFRPQLEALEDRSLPSSNINGHVFIDLTGNGQSDGGGQAGVTVELFREQGHGNGHDHGKHGAVAQTVTAADGFYSFAGLTQGTYRVEEVTPHGFVNTSVSASPFTIHLGANQIAAAPDFDNFRIPNVNNVTHISYTIMDPNGNVVYTGKSLQGHTKEGDSVTVNFTVASGSATVSLVSYETPTGGSSRVKAHLDTLVDQQTGTFTAGSYSLTVHIPDSFFKVAFVNGQPITTFGSADSNIFYRAEGRLYASAHGGNQPFAYSSLSGVVYDDANGDGLFESGSDTVLGGVTVTLTGTNDLGQSVWLTTTSDPVTGAYSFTGLRPGNYTVSDSASGNLVPVLTFTNQGTVNGASVGTVQSSTITNITLGDGQTAINFDLAQAPPPPPSSLSGNVYNDANGTGIFVANSGDTTIPQVLVMLTGTDYLGDSVTITGRTTANGTFMFTGLLAGVYSISDLPPAGFINEASNSAGSLGGSLTTPGEVDNIVVGAGQDGVNYDLPVLQIPS